MTRAPRGNSGGSRTTMTPPTTTKGEQHQRSADKATPPGDHSEGCRGGERVRPGRAPLLVTHECSLSHTTSPRKGITMLNRAIRILAAVALMLGASVGVASTASAHSTDRGCSYHTVGTTWTEWVYAIPYRSTLTKHFNSGGYGWHVIKRVNLWTYESHIDYQRCHIAPVTY